MEDNKERFQYTYSAKQQEEIKRIRSKYAAPEENKMEQLRRLDRSVTQKGCHSSACRRRCGFCNDSLRYYKENH